MSIYKFVSSKQVIRKVFRDLRPPNAEFIHDSIEWMGEALEHIGAPGQLCSKTALITITDHKGSLPGDLYYIDAVAVNTCSTSTSTNTINTIAQQIAVLNLNLATYYSQVNNAVTLSTNGQYISSLTPANLEEFDSYHKTTLNQLRDLNSQMAVLKDAQFSNSPQCLQPLRYGTSTFPWGSHCDECANASSKHRESYIINCNNIQTSFSDGHICLSYKAFATDDECYPMIPDDISYREAMFWYITKMLLLRGDQLRNTKLTYEFADFKWKQYCTQARNAANYPDMDRYQNFMDQWVRLVPNMNRDLNFFEGLGVREELQNEQY